MLIVLKSLLRQLVLPPAGPLLLAALGVWLAGRRRPGGWLLVGAALAALWLLSTPLVADALAHRAGRYPALDLTRPVEAEAIVILGGGDERLSAPEYGGEPAAGPGLL